MQIDAALMQYQNRPLRVPGAASQVQGLGARIADSRPVDKQSPLYEQCREFEAIFSKMLLKEMRNTVDKSGLVNGGWAEDVFQDMLDDEYSKNMARTANLGLADMLYRQLA